MSEGPEPEPVPLSHEDLRMMLEAHARFVTTQGEEGRRANLSLRVVEDFDFSGLDLCEVEEPIYATRFIRCRFAGADFYFTRFYDTSAPGADFRGALFPKAELCGGDFSGADFDGANLLRVFFFECDLRGATFRGADLNLAGFTRCDLEGAIFDEGSVPDTD